MTPTAICRPFNNAGGKFVACVNDTSAVNSDTNIGLQAKYKVHNFINIGIHCYQIVSQQNTKKTCKLVPNVSQYMNKPSLFLNIFIESCECLCKGLKNMNCAPRKIKGFEDNDPLCTKFLFG